VARFSGSCEARNWHPVPECGGCDRQKHGGGPAPAARTSAGDLFQGQADALEFAGRIGVPAHGGKAVADEPGLHGAVREHRSQAVGDGLRVDLDEPGALTVLDDLAVAVQIPDHGRHAAGE
jgi:hypothetical protein